MKLDRVPVEHAHADHPDMYDKGNPLECLYMPEDDGNVIVRRKDSEDSHVTTLTLIYSEPYGTCTCDGFKHRGICSHLCAVYRAWSEGLIDLPTYRPESIDARRVDADQERADLAI